MADTSETTAAEIVAHISSGKVTAVSVVEAALDRAERLKHLNAFIVLNRDGALAAAREVDAGKRTGVLAGLPIVVKDNINTSNLPTSGGTPALQHARPARNAPSLQKLLDAGAVVIGKTNLHELAFGITSTNLAPFAGPVRNPYDTNRIPGGSSGGTSAAIAARITTCGLGSDTGGSTRVPAALTGTVGLRPSVGNGGAERRYHDDNQVVPISHTRDTVGPMGRTVADVALLDAVITGAPQAAAIPLRGVRLGVPACFWSGLDRDVEAVARAACTRLTANGAVLVDVAIDQGGCFETSKPTTHQAPTYLVDEIVHYCVANMPGAVPVTSSHALNHATLPFGLALASKGLRALVEDPHLRAGLNVDRGRITNRAVAESQHLAAVMPEEALAS